MKILHIDTRPDWRGGQQQILLTMCGLRRLGQESQLLTRVGSLLAQRASAEAFPVHTVSPRFTRLQSFLSLKEILHQQRFDVIHAHDPHALTTAWLSRAHRRAALVVSRRVAYPLTQGALSLARYRAAHRIVAISNFVAASVVASGVDPGKVAVVYDGVEIPAPVTPEEQREARRQWGISESTKLLGCVGYLLPEKGQDILVRAMKTVVAQFPDCKLILAGDGPTRASLQSITKELGLSANILFAGFIADVEVIYRALDVFLFPSLAEPLGSSLLAAMAHCIPAIALAAGGVPEIIRNGTDGLLVGKPDPVEFAAAICNVLRDPQTASRVGSAARETVSHRFTTVLLAQNTLREYETALRVAPRN